MQPENFHKEWFRNFDFQPFQTVHAVIQSRTVKATFPLEQFPVNPGIQQHIIEEIVRWNFLCFYICFESLIHSSDSRCLQLFDAKIITDKVTYIISCALFNFCPKSIIIQFLLLRCKAHQNIIPDFIPFRKCQAGGIQAFKDQLGIIRRIQRDANDLEPVNCLEQFIHEHFLFQDFFTEILIIDGQIRGSVIFCLVSCHNLFQSASVIFYWTQFDFAPGISPFVNDEPLHNLFIESTVVGFYFSCFDHIADSQKKQNNGSQPLLAIYNVVINFTSFWNKLGNDTPKKMALLVLLNCFLQIFIQLLTMLFIPVILSLVYRDYILIVSPF